MTLPFLTKAGYAAQELRAAIRRGDFRPGERLDIERVAEQFGMSATPVREALRQLSAEGLLVAEPHRGIRVVEFSEQEVDELFLIRSEVESLATRLGVPRLSSDDIAELERLTERQQEAQSRSDASAVFELSQAWHLVIYRAACGSPHLVDFIMRLWHAFPWAGATVPGRDQRVVEDHTLILSSVKSRDPHLAADLVKRHILSGREFVISQQARGPAAPESANISATDGQGSAEDDQTHRLECM